MEITIVALEPYVSEFSQGGGFLPSTKFAPSSVGEDAAPSEVGRGGRGGFVAAFPSGCTSDAQVGPDSHKRKRTVTKAMFNDDDIGATARAEGTSLPSRLCFILGRDPASSNVVVKHNLTQGPLLSRRHCAIRAWFPRSSCHPSVRGAGMKANIAIAFDCIDLGSINGTFVDNRKMPSGSNNRSAALRPCAVIDADRLLKPEDSSFGLRLFSLSFGIGSKIAEGGALPVEQERLRFDVFVTLAPRFYHSDHIDADTLVRCLFHDTLPVFYIAAPRSSLAALSKVTLDNEEEDRKDGDIDDAFRQSVQRGVQLHALPPPQSNDVPGGPFGGSPTRPTSKPLLLAAKSSGMLSPQKSRITIVGDDNTMNQKGHSSYALRQRTDDVLSSILKDHGYSMLSAAQQSHKALSTAVTGAELEPQQLVVAVATADTSGASHQQTVAQGSMHVPQSDGVAGSNVVVGMSSEVAGSFLPNVSPRPAADEAAPAPTIFEVAADRMQLPSVQNSDVVEVQPHLAQPPHSQPVEEPALLLRRGAAATRRVSGRGPAAPNAAVVLVPDSLPMISQMPVPAFQPQEHAASNEQRSREPQRKKTEETNRPFSMIALSVEEGLVHLSPPPVFLSQPLSQGAHNGETGCELGAEAPTHQQLLPKKAPEAVMKAEPEPLTAGKKSKKGKRNTDPQETIARFCEALRADGGGSVSPAVATVAAASNQGHAMAQTIKAGLQFMAQMNRVEVPAHEELRNDDDEDDVPLGKIVMAPPSATPLPRPPSNIATTTTKITDAATIVPSNIIGVCHDSYVAAPHSAPPPYVNELDSCWSQADEVIQSQLAGGGDMSLDDHQPTAGGCVLIAGGRSHAPTTTTSAHRNMSLRATQRVETLKCLFTDDTDSSDGGVAAAATAHPQPQRKQVDDDSAAFAKRHPSKFGQLRPEVPPAAMIAAVPAAPILGSTPAMHPPLMTGAVVPADDEHVPHRSSVSLWSDGSCASWEGSQEELTLLATQLTAPSSSLDHHNHHSSTQLTMPPPQPPQLHAADHAVSNGAHKTPGAPHRSGGPSPSRTVVTCRTVFCPWQNREWQSSHTQ
ncbi:Hypothetical protein, putative [Bodo saltans]|uniref:FHA domain-containing protein n=1 Tax=Bodo saltans TaxID=75058 RepID=A0A0S4JMR1_BODSA|nr:Hypothetical protein, putative [Bodo saltans]|eukprot:CUG92815.1 Hypothetical protein, putative [Bodo saltans]